MRTRSERLWLPALIRHRIWVASALIEACLATLAFATPLVHAAEPQSFVIPSVFFISKSENRNQVHYAVSVDERCRPLGKQPVYGYWREFERGPRVTSPLLKHEQSAYGLTEPRWVHVRDNGGEVRIGLRGFPDRPLTIETFQLDARCHARARATIAGQDAVLLSIYVKLGFLFSIDSVIVRGSRIADGQAVQEKVDD